MDIKEFLELSAGKWFAQRTIYYLDSQQTENSKSEINTEILPTEHPEVIALCQANQIEPWMILATQKISWDNSVDWGKAKQKSSAVIVLVGDRDNPQMGKLLRKTGTQGKNLIPGRYIMGNDEALTLIVEDENTYSEERIWFVSPNLRLRTNISKYSDSFSTTSFYSEIRRLQADTQQSVKEGSTTEA